VGEGEGGAGVQAGEGEAQRHLEQRDQQHDRPARIACRAPRE